jgi:hypothetical protein
MTTPFSDSETAIFLDVESALEKVGEVAVLHEMLDMLQDALDRDVPQISLLLIEGNVFAANRLLHALKGFIPIFCVESICQHVAAVELLSKSGSAAEVTLAFGSLVPKLQKLQMEIDHYMV